jgi:biotin synthase-like enzyme
MTRHDALRKRPGQIILAPRLPMEVKDPETFFFEMGPIRPPSEGKDYSLLIRLNRNCAWNQCEFCATYKGKKFSYRKVAEVKRDIEVAETLHDAIKTAAASGGAPGRPQKDVVAALVDANPHLYSEGSRNREGFLLRWQNLVHVANWLSTGARTVFLQDADALIMRTPELLEVINYLKETFLTIERVTSYSRSKTCLRKSPEELAALHRAGLSRLHLGLESGCDEVLEFMRKGVTAQEQVEAGKKVADAGISLSEYVMPGLGGARWSEKHALDSARVLSEINPDFIRLRSLVLRRNCPLLAKWQAGQFVELPEDQIVDEIGLFIENLQCSSYLTSDQMANLLFEVEGQLPEDKEQMLETIQGYRKKLPTERLVFRLERHLRSYLAVYGHLDP